MSDEVKQHFMKFLSLGIFQKIPGLVNIGFNFRHFPIQNVVMNIIFADISFCLISNRMYQEPTHEIKDYVIPFIIITNYNATGLH